MSLIRATNSSMPNLVGLGLLIGGGASALSVMVGGNPILNFPGREVADFAFGAATAVTGFFVLKEGSAVAAWLAGALVAGAMVYAGLSVDTDQAGRMLTATMSAAKSGAASAADSVANGTSSTSQYRAIRQLTAAESAECDANLKWTRTDQGRLNCSIASDGKRYVWSAN
ncbi:hypothetical protein [Thiothrix fructosivorans]|uniref:Uncharacterized protein n=1 Tax=Thiothrix fructosivorans TaxID=111770 RepID=A0A8B0SPR4_9GAMM|nr:hypothetical protein [Thiothrix fructosivorans]MBO0613694.1 hypothetical protein [Thiothrix fructosivorans]QTX10892.1 hypothetical protein J1836_000490 [Thiothrix fructosivorans]